MTWKGISPTVNLINKSYQKGISLTKSAMKKIENKIWRIDGIGKWAVDILCYDD